MTKGILLAWKSLWVGSRVTVQGVAVCMGLEYDSLYGTGMTVFMDLCMTFMNGCDSLYGTGYDSLYGTGYDGVYRTGVWQSLWDWSITVFMGLEYNSL